MNSDLYSILYYKHHEPSEKHKRMSIYNRSAQFASFKALDGYEDEINKQNKTFKQKIELSNEEKERINEEVKKIKKGNNIYIKYYYNGEILERNAICKKIDKDLKIVILNSNDSINFDNLIDIRLIDIAKYE